MTSLMDYQKDGACHQVRGVLAFLQSGNIEESWDKEQSRYLAEPKVARWENGREQGYIVSLISKGSNRQLNIAFFEHRNTDSICAIKWEQRSMNSITLATANFGDAVYGDKWDVSKSVGYGEVLAMASWIKDQLRTFWIESSVEKETVA